MVDTDSFLDKRKAIAESIVDDIVCKKYLTINICGDSGTGKTHMIENCTGTLRANHKDVAIIQLYGDSGRQGISFFPLDAYLANRNRWKTDAGVILGAIPHVGPVLNHIINTKDVLHIKNVLTIRQRDDVIQSSEILSRHFAFSRELLLLSIKKKHIVITCDDFQHIDKNTISYLHGLNDFFYQRGVRVSILAACCTTTSMAEQALFLPRYKVRNIELFYPNKEDIIPLLQAWGADMDYSCHQVDAIYAATGGHLLLLRHVYHYFNQNNVRAFISSESDEDFFADLIRQRIQKSKHSELLIQLLICLAAIGREASIYELKCVLNQKAICPVVNEAVSLNFLTRDAHSISFINDSFRAINLENNPKNLSDFYLRYSDCLKKLMPSEYNRRALVERLAGHQRQSQILAGLYLISQIRKGQFTDIEHAITDIEVRQSVTIIGETYLLSFEGKNEEAIQCINNSIARINIPALFIEAQYTRCVLLFKTNRNADSIDALHSLTTMLKDCDKGEFELWGRLMRLLISLNCALDCMEETKRLYDEYKKELAFRLEYDCKSRHAYYELLLLSDSIFDPNVAHMTLVNMLHDLEVLVTKGETDYIPLLYKTLINLSGNSIELCQFEEAGQHAYRAIQIAEEYECMRFTNLGAAYNNYLLAMYFQNTYSYAQLSDEFGSVINSHLYEEDEILIKLNYAGALLGDGQVKKALMAIDTVVFEPGIEYDSYYTCYYYINKSIARYLSGDYAPALEMMKSIENLVPHISSTRCRYYQEYYKIISQVMHDEQKYDTLQELQCAFAELRETFLSPNWGYFKTVYLFSDLQVWTDF